MKLVGTDPDRIEKHVKSFSKIKKSIKRGAHNPYGDGFAAETLLSFCLIGFNDFEKVSIIGLGYIGLPTAALLASKNKNVVGVVLILK